MAFVQQQQRPREDVGGFRCFLLRQLMVVRGNQVKRIFEQGNLGHVGLVQRQGEKGKVYRAAAQRGQQAGRLVLGDLQLQLRIGLSDARQKRGQQVGGDGRNDAKAQSSRQRTRQLARAGR